MGRSVDMSKEELEKLENINSEVRARYEIKTFDRIFDENKAILDNIKKYVC